MHDEATDGGASLDIGPGVLGVLNALGCGNSLIGEGGGVPLEAGGGGVSDVVDVVSLGKASATQSV